MGTLTEVLRGHRVIALDTCVFIYHFEGHPDYRASTASILDAVERGRCRAVVSELTLMELTMGPLRLGRQDVADEYETMLAHFPHMELIPITRAILLKAAELRVKYLLRSPDAIVLSSAIIRGATLAISNDRDWTRLEEVQTLVLGDVS